jgi:hypothetical protein
MTGADSPTASFPWGFDASFSLGAQDGRRCYFAQDVLAGLSSDNASPASQKINTRIIRPKRPERDGPSCNWQVTSSTAIQASHKRLG